MLYILSTHTQIHKHIHTYIYIHVYIHIYEYEGLCAYAYGYCTISDLWLRTNVFTLLVETLLEIFLVLKTTCKYIL